ncbi:PREDICTED: uncharacterized protein LOC108762533 [Trachymyrmex cornetzi]|uniref:uncharacterized protein LOC108762533 n=1 Tax=Trachymyrmex cornetzi TaxID=471704 RepID=UPI00084F566F|nr:PREDICTED: uncharacterized protein LOC108762533 [Trachymyrmex cornetzi]
MSDSINSSDKVAENDLLNMTDNVINETSELATEVCNVTDQWSIVYFESDEEENVEGFSDLIPSSWITMMGTHSWYPMNEHKTTIHKLVKHCTKANPKWNCFSIKKTQESIGNYDRGMKMLVKIEKNPNATLYSDVEEKGKGKRLKRPIKYN